MTNNPKSAVFGGGPVQKAGQSRSALITAREARLRAAGDAHRARCAYCASKRGLIFVEVARCRPASELPEDERFIFQWMCERCRQVDLPF